MRIIGPKNEETIQHISLCCLPLPGIFLVDKRTIFLMQLLDFEDVSTLEDGIIIKLI